VDLVLRARLLEQRDARAARAARAGDVLDRVLAAREAALARVLGRRDRLGRRVDGQDRRVLVPHEAVGVLEDAEVRALVLPVDRRPEKEGVRRRRLRRAAALGLAERAQPPGAVLGAVDARALDRDVAPGVADPALPAPELREARDVHDQALAAAQRLPALLH